MEEKTNMRYVDTSTASVKMTSGVPFTGSSMSGSSIEDEFDNYYQPESSRDGESHGRRRLEVDLESSPTRTSSRRLEVDPESSPTRTSSRRLEVDPESSPTRTSSVVNSVGKEDNLGNWDFKDKNSDEIVCTNINEHQIKHSSSNNISGITTPDQSDYHKLAQNNTINQSMPSSSSQKLGVRTSDNGTSRCVLNLGRTISQRSDSSHKTPSIGSDRSTTNLQYPDYLRGNDVKWKDVPGMAGGRPTSYSPDKPSLDKWQKFQTMKSSTGPREQSSRLSQSLENSQECVLKQWEAGIITSNSMSAISNLGHKHKQKPRVNPFNNDILIDEDHFSDSCENYFRTDRHSIGSTKSSSASQGPDWWQDQSDVSFAELGLSEDHFSHPQGHFGLSRAEELELAIENCKELIREAAPGLDKQKNLVLKLVQLRIKLQEVKEGPEPVPDNVKVILSHKMMLRNSRTSKYYCERCNGAIWGMLQVWYRCTECGYRCHEKCLQQILRTCAKAKVLENPTLVTEICPKEANSLAGQNYRCWECRLAISFKSGHSEPRLCDYVGRYYCEYCHWNDVSVIPARVLHSWDFIPRKVSRSSKQFLKLMQKKAVIRIQDINPMLFVYVEQLNEIKKLREEMMHMKKYILSCPNAMSAKLLLLLENRQHFVECSDRYSMQDLLDAEVALLPELVIVHSTWGQHIKVECELCQGRGFCCELCGDKEVLFPFDGTAVVCAKCCAVLHRHCFTKSSLCPRCERRERRKNSGS